HTTPGETGPSQPILPHANGLIAYASGGTGLQTVEPNGSAGPSIPTPGGAWLLSWSPDGTSIAVTIFPPGEGDRSIWVMGADGSDPRKIASAWNISRPSWSPDGSAIAYS